MLGKPEVDRQEGHEKCTERLPGSCVAVLKFLQTKREGERK
jgi:hypothetical protein